LLQQAAGNPVTEGKIVAAVMDSIAAAAARREMMSTE
jgi:hypothetical protein